MKPLASFGLLSSFLLSLPAGAVGPTVVPTEEGQVGATLNPIDRIFGTSFEAPGSPNNPIFSRVTTIPLPSGTSFFSDDLHQEPAPLPLGIQQGTFATVTRLASQSARSDNGSFVATAFSSDGTAADSMAVNVTVFNAGGSAQSAFVLDDIPTFPDTAFNKVGIGVDDQGRVTVVYTDVPPGMPAQISGARFDGVTGSPIGPSFPVTDSNHAYGGVALLDPAGDRLIVPSSDFATIVGNIVDTTGPTPVVGAEFPISTTPALFANFNPAVGADQQTGQTVVAWENLSGQQGDPVNVYARRFDAAGNPVGDDFRVNSTTANAQGQPRAAVGPGGLAVVVWAGDAATPGDELDVFAQAYDADGNPIGGEIRVNTFTTDIQDRPAVRFLPEPDGQGRPQFAVVWRDVGNNDGSSPRGTGVSYKCFSIDGVALPPPAEIFADGFESGDTSSWSVTQP